MEESLQTILSAYEGKQEEIIPILQSVQETFSYIPDYSMSAIARFTGVPESQVYGVATFYTQFRLTVPEKHHAMVCTSPICAQKGGRENIGAICDHFGVQPGETTLDGNYTIEAVECLGLCDHAPAGLVDDMPVALDGLSPESLFETPKEAGIGTLGGHPRWLSGRCGEIHPPTDIQAFEARGGFAGLRKALQDMTSAGVIAEIEASKLSGRGGAAFPTGLKWKFTAGAEGKTKYVVCNADESEPGTFKDRVIMEGDPFFILEGMAIAAYAIGAQRGYLYVRSEYPRAQAILRQAIEIARTAGYLGNHILGSGFDFDIELRSGAGAYICGEETALFESIEGKRGMPRSKPPFPTTHGLFNQPTAINNVETLCSAAWIIANGADAYRAVGTDESPGTKLFCLSGDVANPGVYEAPFGISLAELIEMAGGVQGKLHAVLLGGAAGAFAGPEQLDTPMSFEGLKSVNLPLGSGVVNIINTTSDFRQYLLSLAHFFAHESCGKCFPCRLGTQYQLEIIQKVADGSAAQSDIAALKTVGATMKAASFCGLGQTAAAALLSALEKWPQLFSNQSKEVPA